MKVEEEIANEINHTLNLNIYKNKRTLDLVDARSLYCYILRKDLNYTLYQVRDTLRDKGKKFDHSSVLHMEKIYDEVIGRKPLLNLIRESILGKISPKFLMLKKIEDLQDENKLEEINNILNQ
jgi:chromosomal replication initiation ATPase DnaA